MTFNRISVLVPTRKRLERLEKLIDSWNHTVCDLASSELVFRIDDDDRDSADLIEPFGHTVISGPRLDGYRSLPAFFEELRFASTGDLLMTANDDMVFRTVGWPQRVLEAANQYPDGMFCLGVDVQNAKNYPFAIVSRRAVDAMGSIHDPRLFWGDVYLRDIFAAFGRAIRLDSVRIDHEWAGHSPDQTFRDAKQGESRNWNDAYWALHRQCVSEAVARLREAGAVAA